MRAGYAVVIYKGALFFADEAFGNAVYYGKKYGKPEQGRPGRLRNTVLPEAECKIADKDEAEQVQAYPRDHRFAPELKGELFLK